jgi:hypothetical protein
MLRAPRFRSSALRRTLTTDAVRTLDTWIDGVRGQRFAVSDHFNPHHLANLYATLPTRDGSSLSHPSYAPLVHHDLAPGHHLVFFNAANPTRQLRADGSDADFAPPPPFTRRMWAGGRMTWSPRDGVLGNMAVGKQARATTEIVDVKKRLDGPTPMVFVKQRIRVKYWDHHGRQLVEEERTHVYQPPKTTPRAPRVGSFVLVSDTAVVGANDAQCKTSLQKPISLSLIPPPLLPCSASQR